MSSFPDCLSVCILLLISLATVIIPANASGSDESLSITTISNDTFFISPPFTISKPGVYSLSTDLIGTNTSQAISIISDDVIIEGAGYTLYGSAVSDQVRYGIRIENEVGKIQNISVRNLTVIGFDTGIFMNGIMEGKIEGCKIRNNLQTGIRLTNGTDISIFGTEVSSTIPDADESGGTGIRITDTDTVTIRSDVIHGNGRGDDGSGLSIIRSSNVYVDETTITGNAASGIITLGPVPGLIIQKNVISSNKVNGITIGTGCTGSLITGNQIFENYLTGLEITSSCQGILSGNTIEDNKIGLSLSESKQFSLTGNVLKGNTLNFDVTGSTPAQYAHSIDISNRVDGRSIWYLTDTSLVTIGSKENPSCIYTVNCSGISISDIIFSRTGAGIFLINSKDINISRIETLDNAFGIRIGYGSQSIKISESNAEKNLIAGYAVSSSDNITFTSCTAQNNLAGFVFTSVTNVTCNDCHAYKQEGLRRRGPSGYQISDCDQVSIINSSAEENEFDGIYLKGSPNALIIGNSLSSNNIAGIALISKGAEIRENNISSNKAGGILVYENTSSISKNYITGNMGRGLLIDESAQSRIWDNIFNNTKNIEISGEISGTVWNETPSSHIAITGQSITGGNYWGAPDLNGFSDTCSPADDGFCSVTYNPGTNNTDYHPLVKPGYQSEAVNYVSRSNISEYSLDINQNGRYEMQDVVALMDRISSGNYSGMEYDFSRDGRVNLQDVIVLFIKIKEI
jgi:parallel beta-helix repeat protein